MKKYILSMIMLLSAVSSKAQWVNKIGDNGFDDPYKYSICYAQGEPSKWLKLEKISDSSILLYVYVGYVCEERPLVDYSFKTDTGYVRVSAVGIKDGESKRIYLIFDVANTIGDVWAKSTILRLRVHDGICGTDVYTFNMTGSVSALKWVKSSRK